MRCEGSLARQGQTVLTSPVAGLILAAAVVPRTGAPSIQLGGNFSIEAGSESEDICIGNEDLIRVELQLT